MSKIEWTHLPGYKGETLNCVTGCEPISQGCTNCYAKRMTRRLQKMYEAKIAKAENPKGLAKYKLGFDKVVCHEESLDILKQWEKPRSVFINSMSDTFHNDVPEEFIVKLWHEMNECRSEHIFWILTKRSQRMREVLRDQEKQYSLYDHTGIRWTPNIWLGVSVENAYNKYRIDDLRQTGASVKFLSCEPLLGSLGALDLTGISMAICGAETGPGARYMNPDWAREIRDQCREQGVAFFIKKLSNNQPIPNDLMIREFPNAKT